MDIKKIISYFTFRMEEKYEFGAVNKIFVINVFTLSASFFATLYTIVAISKAQYSLTLLLFGANLAILLNFWYLRRTKNFYISATFTTIFLMFLIAGLFLVSPFENGSYLWFFIFPPVSLYLVGFKRGTITSLLLLAVVAFVFYFEPLQKLYPEFQTPFKARFISIYFFEYILTAFILFQNLKQLSHYELLFLKNSNSNLAKTEIILRLSHKVRTSLTNINLLLPMIRRAEYSNERNDYLDKINQSVNSLVEEVDQIQNVLVGRSYDKAPETFFSISNLFQQFSNLYRGSEFKSKIRFQLGIPEDLPLYIYGNQIIINKVLFNLTEALILSNQKTTTEIFYRVFLKSDSPDRSELLFEISTSSSFLPASSSEWSQNQLYDFFNIPLQSSIKGLADFSCLYNLDISRFLLKEFNGNLGVKKVAGDLVIWFTILAKKNARSKIIIPASKEYIPEKAAFKPGDGKTGVLKNATVLIAEDNFTNQQVLLLGLKNKLKDIEVVVDGREAIEKFTKKHFDIVLLDLQMPVLDGFKTVEKIRELESGTTIHTPVIAITANVFKDAREQCFNSGFDAYFEKPYRLSELVDKMEELLKQWPGNIDN